MAMGDRKVMLGFLVRWCEVALGHKPTTAEFAAWANDRGGACRESCLFGRPITAKEAETILGHPGRPVTVNREPAELARKRQRKRKIDRREKSPSNP